MSSAPVRAAAVIRIALKKKNRQTIHELVPILAKHKIAPHHFHPALRIIRDTYGANALVKRRVGRQVRYVLDPTIEEGRVDANEQARRGLSEAEHLLQVLDWLSTQYGNSGFIRRGRRYAKNLVAELGDLVDATGNGKSP